MTSCIYFPSVVVIQWFSNLGECQNHLEHLGKPRLLSPKSRVSDSVGLGRGSRLRISNEYSGDGDTAGPGDHTLGTTSLTDCFSAYGPQTMWLESPRTLAKTEVYGLSQNLSRAIRMTNSTEFPSHVCVLWTLSLTTLPFCKVSS